MTVRKYRPRIVAFLIFGLGGTLAGLVVRLLPLHTPDVGILFFVGWWTAAAIGSMLFPQRGGGDSPG
ncbi:MAG: hypothetical protein D6694_11235 [Gammaproteobacteria bacterium]|nr:MAG: hypothetical protein D6694_11235 [Gammaproteobacteria bacterium]